MSIPIEHMKIYIYWEYKQSNGNIYFGKRKIERGYSGKGTAKDTPSLEHLRGMGPIPRGWWKILSPRTSVKTGAYVLPLEPYNHNAHGRSSFQIHGDSKANPGTASSGCIILSRATRQKIWQSGVRYLKVVS
ncbi:tlde1 domain-containing protein [Agarivorans gilvus]|uniref:Tlde1 domain-containing protein n=1 Tax=Agarivorans gilvus TaxID=680279 RepID=A0ABQ1I7S7_9ALTE|nr:tlde1 domain-containing protein [Agarivorans gilvus]GGB22360.1 hypothetical protein GCM10007414_39640 [Agarivorans gilvus]